MPTEVGSSAAVFNQDRDALSYQSPVLSKNVNSGVSHSLNQFHKTSTPKSPKVHLALTESSVSDCHQSPTGQLHFDWSCQSHHCQWMAILQQMHKAKIMVSRHKLLLMGILTCPMIWVWGLFPLRFLMMTLMLIHHCVNILGLVIVPQNSMS